MPQIDLHQEQGLANQFQIRGTASIPVKLDPGQPESNSERSIQVKSVNLNFFYQFNQSPKKGVTKKRKFPPSQNRKLTHLKFRDY